MPPAQGAIAWRSCAGGGAECVPYLGVPDTIPSVDAGGSPVGTVFEASATVNGQVVVARSRPYLGPVRWTEPPGIRGPIQASSFVRPVPARWTGGWGVERSYPQLQVCRTARARRCLTISDAHHWNACRGTGAVIAKRYTGWYLRAVDRRAGPNVPVPAIGYRLPEAIPPAPVDGKTAVPTPAVRIAPAVGPPRRRCGGGVRLDRAGIRALLRRNAELERTRRAR